MVETKVYAMPAAWPQPAFTIGETVYFEGSRGHWKAEPMIVVGLICYPDNESPEDMSKGFWTYRTVWAGSTTMEEYHANDLTREPWEYTYPVPAPARSDAGDDFDPFLDSDDLP